MSNRLSLSSGEIEWSSWAPWTSIPKIYIPEGPGVYEVVYGEDRDGERLQIGETKILRSHLRKSLLGDKRHERGDGRVISVGGKIQASEDVRLLVVRWAETGNYHAVRAELERRYGRVPKYRG
jgi:hypothetical protein